jgi:hypothetical protein
MMYAALTIERNRPLSNDFELVVEEWGLGRIQLERGELGFKIVEEEPEGSVFCSVGGFVG